MPRPKDRAWNFVIRLGSQKWRCPYCNKEVSGSVTRVKGHFLKQTIGGIVVCTKVPEHIRTLMELLLNHEVRNKEDIAWKFVNRLEDSKWRCYYCSGEFFKDLTGVKGHLLGVPNEGISICTQVPDHVRKIMQSLQDEMAEEESRGANGQSSAEPQSRGMPAQAEVAEEESREVAEEQSREAHGQSSIESNSRDMPSQAEVAEEEIREANRQFSTEPQSRDMLSPAVPRSSQSLEDMKNLLTTTEGATDMENLDYNQERRFHETLAMPPPAQNIHEQSREAHGQSSVEPKSRDMPTHSQQAGVAEEGIRGANCQLSTEPESRDMPPPAVLLSPLLTPQSWEFVEHVLQTPEGETLATPSLAQNSRGESTEEGPNPLSLLYQRQCSIQSQIQMNDQQTPTGASSFQYDQLPAGGNSNCLQDCNWHSQLQTSMDVDPSIASQRTNHITGAQINDSKVPEVATNTTGPSSSQEESREVAEGQSREANRQSSTEPQSRDMPTQAEVEAEEESREANGQFSAGPLFSPGFLLEDMEQLNFSQQDVIGLNSAQQSQTERQFHQSSTMPSQVQNNHVQPVLVPPQHQNVPHQSETRNVLQNPTAPSSTALMDMDSCILSSSQAPKNAPPGATEISNFNQQDIIGLNSDQQSQAEREFPQSSTMLSLVQNSHGISM